LDLMSTADAAIDAFLEMSAGAKKLEDKSA
jgi:hypothetical protein